MTSAVYHCSKALNQINQTKQTNKQNIALSTLKFERKKGFTIDKCLVNDVEGIGNSTDPNQNLNYCKVPKFLDTRNLCCNLPKIQTKRSNLRVFCQKDANVIANSEDPDQTAPLGASSLIWVCTVCPDISVRKLRFITVICLPMPFCLRS